MNTARTLAIAAFTMASLPLMAQQAGSMAQQPGAASPTQTEPAQTQQQMAPQSTPAPATASAVQLKPVDGELVDKLDTKTAKTGDAVVIKTKSNVTTADGKEIPKGSKLVGKVVGVKPIGAGNENSQVALQFDHVELKGGQNMPVHAELQALSESGSAGAASAEATPSASGAAMSSTAGASAPSGAMSGNASGSSAAATQSPAQTQPQMSNSGSSAGSSNAASTPAAGTVVARTGNIAIKTTSIPGVLLATNEPGQQDPRMARSSGILLGPKHDIHLEGGTQVVVGVGASSAANPDGGN